MPATPAWFFKGRKCCRCGSDKTHLDGGVSPKWRSCKCGKQDCTKWLCLNCFYDIGKSERRRIKDERIKNTKCCKCGSNKTYGDYWIKLRNDKGNWDEKSYICKTCHNEKFYAETIGRMRKCRSEDIYIKKFEDLSEREKGKIVEDVVAEELGLENQNVVSDNYNYPYDLTYHEEYGNIQVKARALDINNRWKCEFRYIHSYDTLCVVCVDSHWKTIERVLMIPTDELEKTLNNEIERESISIYKDKFSEYNMFRTDHIPYDKKFKLRLEKFKDNK